MFQFQFLPLASAVSSVRDLVQSCTQLQVHVRSRLRHATANAAPQDRDAMTVSAGHQLLDVFCTNLNSTLDLVAFGLQVNTNTTTTTNATNVNTTTNNTQQQQQEQLLGVLAEMMRHVEVFLGCAQSEFFDPVVNPSIPLVRDARRAGNTRIGQTLAMFTPQAFQQRVDLIRAHTLPFLFPGGAFVPRTADQTTHATPQQVIDSLPLVMMCDDSEMCSICLESFSAGQFATRLPCGHMFCVGSSSSSNTPQPKPQATQQATATARVVDDCESEWCGGAQKWLQDHNTCPVCRFELPTHITDKPQPTCTSPRSHTHHTHAVSQSQSQSQSQSPSQFAFQSQPSSA